MIIGTAGHIDHGKSALVQALTGRPMDPLAEERRRGITLDLHFAPLPLADGTVAGVVDVPGHEDLVRTMVAGAAGLDLVLLVVAADEGIMPQTREHLAIVEQLRVPAGIPIITKADLVQPDWLALVAAEVAAWLKPSPVRFAPPLPTSAVRGDGVEELRARISDFERALAARDRSDLFRLPVDRALSLPGAGTVVTGTVWSGELRLGDAVRLLPGDTTGRVRSLEQHGRAVERAGAGQRLAVGLAGIERARTRRGSVLVRQDDPWEATTALDVSLHLLPTAPRPLTHRARVRLHLGTAEIMARVQLGERLEPGGEAPARLALEQPIVARGGDRFVLRSYSPVDTIGGGWVLDPLPPRGRAQWPEGIADSDPAARLPALVARRRDGVEARHAPFLLGTSPGGAPSELPGLVLADGRWVATGAVRQAEESAVERVRDHHRSRPADPGLPLETLRQALARLGAAGRHGLQRVLERGDLALEDGLVRVPGFRPSVAGGNALVDRVVARVAEAGLTPPSVRELETELGPRGVADALRLAAREGLLVSVDAERYYGPGALDRFTAALRNLAVRGPFAPPAVREVTGLSRKFLIPLLEWADRTGLTRREGDARVGTGRLTG